MYLDLMASNLSAWAADIFPDAPDKVLRSDDNSESRAFKALISTFSPASTLILSPRQRSQIASYLSNALSKPSFCGEAAAGSRSDAAEPALAKKVAVAKRRPTATLAPSSSISAPLAPPAPQHVSEEEFTW